MPNWTQLFPADLDDYLPAGLAAKARTQALSGAQADPFAALMPDAVAEVRSAVLTCSGNAVDADPLAVPRSLRSAALLLIAEKLLNRIQHKIADEFKTQLEAARESLAKVASCERAVEPPDTPAAPAASQRPGGPEIVTKTTRLATRDLLKGL